MDKSKIYFNRKKKYETLEKDGIFECVACSNQDNIKYSKLFLDELPFDVIRAEDTDLTESVPAAESEEKSCKTEFDVKSQYIETEDISDLKNLENLYRSDDAVYRHYRYIKCENYDTERDMHLLCGIKRITVLVAILLALVLVSIMVPQITLSLN